MRMFYINQLLQRYDSLRTNYKEKLEEIEEFQIEVLAIINLGGYTFDRQTDSA